MDEYNDKTICKAMTNHDKPYSIGPADRENPPGWKEAGESEHLAWIKEIWTDAHPLSLRTESIQAAKGKTS